MVATYAADVTDRFTTRLIRQTARRLIDQQVFSRSDFEDLVQEMTLTLVERRAGFDPRRARWSTFVRTVVQRTAISLRRIRMSERRGGGQTTLSLNVAIRDEDCRPTELASQVHLGQLPSHLGRVDRSAQQQREFEFDLASVLAGLPAEAQALCRQLQHGSVTAVARQQGVARSTLVHRLGKLRKAFQAAGLQDYVY